MWISACCPRAQPVERRPDSIDGVLGRFHELSLETADILASVEFYERLGFSQAPTGDAWSHPYGVLTDGRIFLGLHRCRFPSPSITFVRPAVADWIPRLCAHGFELVFSHTGDDVFNEAGFRDPTDHLVTLIEARTYSPVARSPDATSLCGYFSELSLPATDFEAAKAFWEPLGFIAGEESDSPYAHLPLTSDHLNLAFHRPQTLDRPMLVFRDSDMAARITRLRELNVRFLDRLPRGLSAERNAMIEAPEGTVLLLLEDEG